MQTQIEKITEGEAREQKLHDVISERDAAIEGLESTITTMAEKAVALQQEMAERKAAMEALQGELQVPAVTPTATPPVTPPVTPTITMNVTATVSSNVTPTVTSKTVTSNVTLNVTSTVTSTRRSTAGDHRAAGAAARQEAARPLDDADAAGERLGDVTDRYLPS